MRTYLDHNATSPLRPEAREAMATALDLGNPSSVHIEGQRARAALERARSDIAEALGGDREDLVFTSGATEAINQAMFAARAAGYGRVLASAVEHAAVGAAAHLHGTEVEVVAVDGSGVIRLDELERLLHGRGGETLVVIQAANNETGVLQPVAEAVRIARDAGAMTLVDAVQVFGRLRVDVAGLGADMVVVSGHKLGGPMGTGVLQLRSRLAAHPLIAGGGQELRRRGGTENLAGGVGFAAAAGAAMAVRETESCRLYALRDRFEAGLIEMAPDALVFGTDTERLPNTSAFAIPGRAAETLLIALDLAGFAVSSGSACSSGKVGKSHVLAAMGVSDEMANGMIRVSLGWSTTDDDIENFGDVLSRILGRNAAASAAA